jgi:HlyD family secretion protein
MKQKILKIALPAIITFICGYGGYSFYQYHNNQHQIRLYGNVDIREVSASFRVSGRLKKLFFDEGDKVTEGQLLASLEVDTFSNELELAKANLDAASANYENAEIKFKRTKNLFKNNSASKQEYDNDKFALDRAQADLEAQKAKVKIAQTALDDTNLHAPSDAFVMTRPFEVGSILSSGQTVYNLSLNNQAYVRAYITEADLSRVTNGMAVKIITDSNSQYQGQIGFISAKAEFTPKSVETAQLRTDLVYRVRITVQNPDSKLKQGMPVTVSLSL